jgi:hypothetical protein
MKRRLSSSALAIFLMSTTGSTGCSGGSSTDKSGTASTAGSTSGAGTGGASTAASTSSATGGASTAASTSSSGSGAGTGGSSGLNPAAAPGTNFDLMLWELQEPVGTPGNPTTILPAALAAGFQDAYFYTDKTDGAMTFFDPEDGVTTANSSYPRSELREMASGTTGANWPVAGTNTLSATVEVVDVPDHVCVGQIHIGTAIAAGLAASTKPLLELFYYANGNLALGLESGPAGTEGTPHPLTTVPLGTKFSYAIELTGAGAITITINGTAYPFTMPASFNGYGMYFKAGDYDQSADPDAGPTVGATVKLYALQVAHGP